MRRKEPSWDSYIDRLRDFLADEFDWDIHTSLAFGEHFRTYHFYDRIEWICDSPVAGNWRLKPDRAAGHPWALRMAFYGQNTSAAVGRLDRIDSELAVILREETNQ